jgi:hypothetical protein
MAMLITLPPLRPGILASPQTASTYRGVLQAGEEVVVLGGEDALLVIRVHLQPQLLGTHGLLVPLLGAHELRPTGVLGHAYPSLPRFLHMEQPAQHGYVITQTFTYPFLT